MRLRLIIAVTAIVALAAAFASDAFAAHGYRTYTFCSVVPGTPSSNCTATDWGAFFKVKNGKKTHYRLCVNPPPGASKQCKKLKTNKRGKDIAQVWKWNSGGGRLNPVGTYKFVWKKGGHKLDKDKLVVHGGD